MLLRLKNIGKIYDSNDILTIGIRGINLDFDYNEFVTIEGESGSGKSTLLNVIGANDSYEEGELYINGEETSHYGATEWEKYREKYIATVFQDFNIIENLMERFIIDYQKRKGKSPSFREVMKALNMSSLNLVRTYILALENSGRIERTRLGNIDMLPKLRPSGVAITPIVGSIACGQPVDAVEQIEESVTLPRAIFGGGDLFILHTHGDSMIDIGIKHGDLVVIRKQNTAENGDIIVAMMNGETTLKRFYKRNGKVVLHPENKEMKDIIVKDCEIQGVLVSCIHIYN